MREYATAGATIQNEFYTNADTQIVQTAVTSRDAFGKNVQGFANVVA